MSPLVVSKMNENEPSLKTIKNFGGVVRWESLIFWGVVFPQADSDFQNISFFGVPKNKKHCLLLFDCLTVEWALRAHSMPLFDCLTADGDLQTLDCAFLKCLTA